MSDATASSHAIGPCRDRPRTLSELLVVPVPKHPNATTVHQVALLIAHPLDSSSRILERREALKAFQNRLKEVRQAIVEIEDSPTIRKVDQHPQVLVHNEPSPEINQVDDLSEGLNRDFSTSTIHAS